MVHPKEKIILTPVVAILIASFASSALAADLDCSLPNIRCVDDTIGPEQEYSTIQSCLDAAQPGDTCLVLEGTYNGAILSSSGNPGSRITILADTGGLQPVIDGDLDYTDERYVTVDGFHMIGTWNRCSGCSFIEIKNNIIEKTGFGIGGSNSNSQLNGNDILISGNDFRLSPSSSFDIIKCNGDRWVVRDNYANNIDDTYDDHLDMFQSSCGFANPSDYILYENNTYSDITGPNVHFFLWHTTTNCPSSPNREKFIIRHNKIRYIGANAITFDVDSGAPNFEDVAIYNNVFGETRYGSPSESWMDYTVAVDHVAGTALFYNNILYDSVDPVGAEGVHPPSIPSDGSIAYDPDHTITDDGSLETCVNAGTCKINEDPGFVGYSSDDFSLSSDSTARDFGTHLTSVSASDTGSGIFLVVDDAYPFQDGWAGVDPDTIAVGSVSNAVQISSIDYETDTIALANPIPRSDGDPVWLYRDSDGTRVLYGSAPDSGAVEYVEGSPAPVDGQCGPTESSCTAGTLNDIADNSTHYLWQCLGIDGGSDASCDLEIPPACIDPCSDGNPCTSGDACNVDVCQGTPITSCSMTADGCCLISSCDHTNDADCDPEPVLCDGLAGLYRLDGDAADSSGLGNDGIAGGVTTASGIFDDASAFDSMNDYIQVPFSALPGSGTVSLWAYPTGFNSGPNYFFGYSDSDSVWSVVTQRVQIYTDDSTGMLDLGMGDSHITSTDIIDLDIETWYHIALTWESTGYALYLNGTEVDSGTFSGFSAFRSLADIGNDGNLNYRNEGFNGTIDEVAIWNRTLTSQDVSDLYNSGQAISCHAPTYHKADTDSSCTVEMTELVTFIGLWYIDSTANTIGEVIEAMGHQLNGIIYC